eukprot:gene25240-4381_t
MHLLVLGALLLVVHTTTTTPSSTWTFPFSKFENDGTSVASTGDNPGQWTGTVHGGAVLGPGRLPIVETGKYCSAYSHVLGSPGVASVDACAVKIQTECPSCSYFSFRNSNGACHKGSGSDPDCDIWTNEGDTDINIYSAGTQALLFDGLGRESVDDKLCTNNGVKVGSVTNTVCTDTKDMCEVYMKKGSEHAVSNITTCRQYCAAYGMTCNAQYDDDNGCGRGSKYDSCDYDGGETTSDHICQCGPPRLCTNNGVKVGSVTNTVCTDTKDMCEVYMKKGSEH